MRQNEWCKEKFECTQLPEDKNRSYIKNKVLTGGKRFEKWIQKGDLPLSGGFFIDIYNQMYNKDGIAGTIHTRISDGNYWWVTQVYETK